MNSQVMNPKDGQSRWPYSAFSRIKEASLDNTVQHVCMRIPRDAFRQSGMCFNEIRQSSQPARYWNMMLQLFLEMCCGVETEGTNPKYSEAVDIYPFQKVYLEWIPCENDSERACEYRLHGFLLTNQFDYGYILNRILEENVKLREEASKRSTNSRTPDPLCALADHQHFKRVTNEVYYRTICGLANGHRRVENNLDQVLHHKSKLSDATNIANPLNIWTVRNACANCKNPHFKQSEDNYVNGVFTFRHSKRVIRLSPEQCSTKTFCNKYLPDYQTYVDKFVKPTQHVALPGDLDFDPQEDEIQGKDKAERPDDNRLDMMTLTEYDVRTVTEQEEERIAAFSSRSDFQILSEDAKDMYIGNCQDYEDSPDFEKRYYQYQYEWALPQFKSRCLNVDANISEKGKVMMRWAHVRNPPDYKNFRKFDHSLSIFANRVIKIMEEAEQYYLISTAHREFYQVMHARYDAYRRDMGLHLNIFQTGEGATSKSFIFDLMKRASIPNTIDQLTYETAKANAVDGNRNDTITVCHEAPPGMFRTGKMKNMDNGMEAAFKERLTSNHVSCKTFYLDEATGKRSQRITKSECIGVWMGATNDDPDDVEEALKTRFYWGNFEKVKRPGKDIDDCINGERSLSRGDRLRREAINLEWQEEQYRVYLVEKMIWCGILKDVEMDAFYIIKQRFKKEYHGESVREVDTRDWQRIAIFARIQAICTALATVFQIEGGQYYGLPFDEEQLLAVEPYLVVTQEMVYFTLTMMDSQFVHPAEHKILNKIFKLYKAKSAPYGNPMPEDDSGGYNYEYIKMPGSLASNSKNLQNELTAAEGKTSVHNIQAFLVALSKMAISSHPYNPPVPVEEGRPANWPEPNTSKHKRKAQCAFITTEAVYIHVELLVKHSNAYYDPVLDTVKSITHEHQESKKMMVARFFVAPSGRKYFHAFDVIKKRPMEGSVIKYENVLYNSQVSKTILGMENDDSTRQSKEITIDVDIDTWAKNKRKKILGRTWYDEEELGKDAPRSINYPYDYHTVRNQFAHLVAQKKQSLVNKRKRIDDAVGNDPKAIRIA